MRSGSARIIYVFEKRKQNYDLESLCIINNIYIYIYLTGHAAHYIYSNKLFFTCAAYRSLAKLFFFFLEVTFVLSS